MNILITGANGFIGQHLVNALSSHHLILSTRTHNSCDNLNFQELPAIDQLYHLAWTGTPVSDAKENRQNVAMTKKLFRQAKIAGVGQFIFLSSVGAINQGNPKNAYGKAKYAVEQWLVKHATPTMKITIIRASNVIGNRQRYKNGQGILPYIKQCFVTKTPITLWGNSSKDYIDVQDLVKALSQVNQQQKIIETYSIGSGINVTLSEIMNLAAACFGYTVPVRRLRAHQKDTPMVKVDYHLATDELNWTPQCDPLKTIKDFLTV